MVLYSRNCEVNDFTRMSVQISKAKMMKYYVRVYVELTAAAARRLNEKRKVKACSEEHLQQREEKVSQAKRVNTC